MFIHTSMNACRSAILDPYEVLTGVTMILRLQALVLAHKWLRKRASANKFGLLARA